MESKDKVKVSVNGTLKNRILKNTVFEGSLTIDNKNLEGLKLHIDNKPQIIMVFNEETSDFEQYGEIYTNDKFSEFAICVKDKDIGWNSKDGTMISAPANDRNTAVNISNKLMKNVLKQL
jgi:hypothetical protein